MEPMKNYCTQRDQHRISGLSVVVPAHNEEDNIVNVSDRLSATLLSLFPESKNFEIIIVNDGSLDSTGDTVDKLAVAPHIRVVHHETNRGYGAALKSGFAAARFEYVSFIDGDGQLFPEDLEVLAPFAAPHKISMGYRVNRKDPVHRKLLGKTFSQIFVPLFIGIRFRDVDCALKIIPRKLIREAELMSDGALINAELLATAKIDGYAFSEHPVRHSCRKFGEQSGGKLSVIGKVFIELLSIRQKLNERKTIQSSKQSPARKILTG